MGNMITASRWLLAAIAGALVVLVLGFGGVAYPAGQARADEGYSAAEAEGLAVQAIAAGQTEQAMLKTEAASASKVKAAKKAYKNYLAKYASKYKYFRVVKMGNGGVPVLLCTNQQPFTALGSNYWITTDVLVYDKSKKTKVKNLGQLTTGGTAFQLQYAKGAVYGYRVAGLHTFAAATVKNGRLSLSGMFDEYGPNFSWRHFSNYNPKSKTPLWESKALGKFGTKAQYDKLVSKYGKHPLKMFANTAANRSKHI